MSSEKLSSTFVKNGRESIVIAESDYKGFALVDIRTFYVDTAGELAPTRKGVTIRAEKLKEFVATLSAFAKTLEEKEMEEPGEESGEEYNEFVKSLPLEA